METLIEKVERDGKRKAQLEMLSIRLADFTEHKEDCAGNNKDETGRVNRCDCGLVELIEQVDAL